MFGAQTKKIWFWLVVGVVFFGFVYLIRSILLPFVLGLLIAYFLDPAARWMEKKGYSRTTATSLLIIGFFGVGVVAVAALSPVLYDQIMAFVKAAPEYVRKGKEFIAPQIDKVMSGLRGTPVATNSQEVLSNASESALGYAKTILMGIFTSGANFFNLITLLLLTPVVAFYLLRDWQRFITEVDELLPRESADTIREQMGEIDRTIAGYLRGQVNVCLILAAFYMVTLGLTGLNYGVLIGLVSGLITFIPFVGAMLGFVVAMAIALFQFDELWRIAAVAIVYGLGQMLEGNFLVPKLVGDKVGLHPVWVIFGMLAGGVLFGFVGVLLAVPISAIIGVLVRFMIGEYRASLIYVGDMEVAPSQTIAQQLQPVSISTPSEPRQPVKSSRKKTDKDGDSEGD